MLRAVPEVMAAGVAQVMTGVVFGVMSTRNACPAPAMPSLTEATARLVAFDRTFLPDGGLRGYYDDKFGKYRELYERLKPFNEGY